MSEESNESRKVCEHPYVWLWPAWREFLALYPELLRGSGVEDDALIADYREYLDLGIESEFARPTDLPARLADVHQAHTVHRNNDLDLTLRAAILSKRTREEIADYFRLDVNVVAAHEALFYDVRDFLDCPGQIVPAILQEEEEAQVWLRAAFHLGWDALLALWGIDPMSDETAGRLHETVRGQIHRQAWLAAHSRTIDEKNANAILRQALQIRRMDRLEADSEAKRDLLQERAALVRAKTEEMRREAQHAEPDGAPTVLAEGVDMYTDMLRRFAAVDVLAEEDVEETRAA